LIDIKIEKIVYARVNRRLRHFCSSCVDSKFTCRPTV